MQILRKGDIVRHEVFGDGVVTEDQHGGEVAIDFNGQTLVLSTELASLVRISERAERTRRRDTFLQETDGEDEHFPGSHWEPFFDSPQDATANMQAVIDAELMNRFSSDCLPPRTSLATGIEWPGDPVYFTGPARKLAMRLICQVNDARQAEIVEFFPYVGRGKQYTITIERVTVWPDGFAAQIDAAVGAAAISFFDCRYGENRNLYSKDAALEFVLSAIAYECAPAEPKAMDFTFPAETRETMSAGDGEPPRQLSLGGAAMLARIEEWDCDDYSFRAPVQHVEAVEMLGRPAWIVTARVCRCIAETTGDPDDFDLPIVVTDRAWRHGSEPIVGQDIAGAMWLQGFMKR